MRAWPYTPKNHADGPPTRSGHADPRNPTTPWDSHATDDPVPEIAKKLQVSANTVRKQVVTLRKKFAAESRPELIRKAKVYGALH